MIKANVSHLETILALSQAAELPIPSIVCWASIAHAYPALFKMNKCQDSTLFSWWGPNTWWAPKITPGGRVGVQCVCSLCSLQAFNCLIPQNASQAWISSLPSSAVSVCRDDSQPLQRSTMDTRVLISHIDWLILTHCINIVMIVL